jgi:hypothetical protein
MADLATREEFEVRYGRQLRDPEDFNRVEALLADASALVRDVAGDDFDTVPAIIVSVVCEVVRRAFDNPAGYQSETLGDYTWRGGAATNSGLYLTAEEKRTVRRAAGTLSVSSLTVTNYLPLPALDPYLTGYLGTEGDLTGVVIVNLPEPEEL